MSAAEKLRALVETDAPTVETLLTPSPARRDALMKVAAALPQIVAVVDRSEALRLRPDTNGLPPRDCGYVRLSEIDALRSALAALDEALA